MKMLNHPNIGEYACAHVACTALGALCAVVEISALGGGEIDHFGTGLLV